jgi:hypothetical protein
MDDRAPPDAKTLPLTMPDQLSRELAEARQKLATLELLAKLREHGGFDAVRTSVRWLADAAATCARRARDAGEHDVARQNEASAEAWELLLELLGG